MAFNFRELNFILGLRTDKFLEGAKKAEQSANESRGKVERPFHLTAKVDNVITSFAKVGLAIDGLKKTYNLFIGPAKRMVELSNIQEKADTKLASALKTRNIYTEENFKLLKDQASAIQSVTTSGDEQNEMLQALAINMGITFDKIDEVTKGSIGLAASFAEAGLNQETALKGIALAYQGNFTQLQRYIPALRETKNETEKMAILQQAMKDGFIQAQDAAKDGAGQMEQFSNILGDVQEVGGDLVKEALLPILKLLKPIAESIASVDAGTRNAVIGLAAFFLIVSKGRTTLLGMRAAIIALNASIGPAGWLIIGIGAAATALGIYAASTDTAAKSNLSLKNSNLDVADSFNKVKQAAEKAYGKESIENTLKVLAYFKKEVLDSRKIYEDLINKQKSGDKEVTQDMINNAERRYQFAVNRERALIEVIENRRKKEREIFSGMTEDQLKELDKRRDYEYQTNKISLSDYVFYLNLRKEMVKKELGEETVEWLKWHDNIKKLQDELAAKQMAQGIGLISPPSPEIISIIKKRFDEIKVKEVEAFGEMTRVSTQFFDFNEENLEFEYFHRSRLLDAQIEMAEDAYGKESDLYKDLMNTKWALEVNFNAAKRQLAIVSTREAINLAASLMDTFQGQSKIMFEIGKGAAIAQATINAYEGASLAIAKYPFPLDLAIAAIKIANGLAQVQKISAVKFEPSGKRYGGMITDADLLQSMFTPRGEDGIVGVRRNEFIMNQGATRLFLPMLDLLNQIGMRNASIPSFQGGGAVQQPANITARIDGAIIERAIERGFEKSKIQIIGTLKADGHDIYLVVEKQREMEERRSL